MSKLIGYVTSRPFGGFCMPVPAQNSCLREYCMRNNYIFKLPQLEHKYQNCYMQLYSTINSASSGEGVLMYSYEMLPEGNKLKNIINLAISRNISFHFVLENYKISNLLDYQSYLRSKKIQKLVMRRDLLQVVKNNVGK